MNAKRFFIAALLLLAGSITANLYAQATIDALVKKCENMNTVDVNTVMKKDTDTKKLVKSVVNIVIKNDAALVKELRSAFEKDRDAADEGTETKREGKLVRLFLRFGNKNYSFTAKDDSNASLSVIEGGEKRLRGPAKVLNFNYELASPDNVFLGDLPMDFYMDLKDLQEQTIDSIRHEYFGKINKRLGQDPDPDVK